MTFFRMFLVTVFLLCVASAEAGTDPCENQNHENIYYETWRNVNNLRDSSAPKCDHFIDANWYRFHTDGDDQMPTYPVQLGKCGTAYPIWINGQLPQNSAEGIINLTACVTDIFDNCSESWTIQAKSCDTFHVYNLVPTSGCELAYCVGLDPLPTAGDAEATEAPEADPCDSANHVELEGELWRNVHMAREGGSPRCDHFLDHRWYKFNVQDDFMPTFAVSPGMCGTMFPVWLQGSLPSSTSEGSKTISACTSTYSATCEDTWEIDVKRCHGYHVYKLQPTPGCEMAYCIGINIPQTEPPTTNNTDCKDESDLNEQLLQECQQKQKDTDKDVNTWRIAAFVCIGLLVVTFIVIGALMYQLLYKSRRSPETANSHLHERSAYGLRGSKVVASGNNVYDLPVITQSPPPKYEYLSVSRPSSGSLIKSSHQ